MSVMFRVFLDCKYRQYQRGHAIGSNYDFPPGSSGCYLPGDEPGFVCKLSGDFCDEDDKINIEHCRRIEKTELYCLDCLEEDEKNLLFKDKLENQYYCSECEDWTELKGEN